MFRQMFFSVVFLSASSLLCRAEGEGNSTPVSMADGSEQSDSLRNKTVDLEEVNITAVKQTLELKDEPLSSTVLGRKELEQLGVAGIKGISDIVPNFYIPDYGSRITSSIYVRGIGARMDQPSVGLNIDNVPFLNKDAYDFDIADIASVEMLRGPQSTLYGRNTMGGVINITTLSPMRYQGWRFMAEAGNGALARASIGWYHKFNSKIATALIGSYSHSGGFFTNGYNGEKLDKENSGALRWKTDWRPADNLYIQNSFSTSILRQGGYPYEYKETGEIAYNDTCFYRRFLLNDGLTLRYRNDVFTMTSITSVQHIDDNMTLDQDFLPENYFTLTQAKKETAVTEELMMKGESGDRNYRWLAGFFGFYRHLNMSAPVTFKTDGIERLIISHRNDANPNYPISWNEDSFVLNSDFTMPSFGLSLYHESDYDAGRWHFTAGIRLDFENSVLNYISRCNTSYTIHNKSAGMTQYAFIPIDIDDKGKLKRHYFNWTPKLCVLYDISEGGEDNVYVNVAKGYKSGGFNTQMFSDVLQQRLMGIMGIGAQYDVDKITGYKPEYSWNYEAGAHLSFAGGRLSTDMSVFYIDCHDQQLTMFPDGTTTGRIMTNAGKTRSFGAELSLEWRPLESLLLKGGYGYTNAKFVEYDNGKENYSGNYLPYAPRNTLFLQCVYSLAVRKGTNLVFDVNATGTGKIYWNESNTESQKLYFLAGASLTLEAGDWSVQLWGKNLTSTKYHTFYFMSMGNEFLQRGKPLQGGVTLRFNI